MSIKDSSEEVVGCRAGRRRLCMVISSEYEERKWDNNLDRFYVLVEVIRRPNDACSVLCGILDDGSRIRSEYGDIQEVDG